MHGHLNVKLAIHVTKHTQASSRLSLLGKDLLQSVHYKPTIIRTDSERKPEILVRDVTGTSFSR